jgi:predicted AlkP superfamily pyrophosphatase or phosphodiesterase
VAGRVRATLAAALVVLAAAVAAGQEARHPKLIVLLVVDQMRGDYVDKFQQQWTRGLHRLVTQGARFRQADYPYYNTVTCPGHTTIGTGTLPPTHGVILNGWWDRETQKNVTCTQDASVSNIGYGRPVAGGDSAARIGVPALADELRAQESPTAQVLSFSLKARAAISLGGHHPDAVTWFEGSGVWATSSAFAKAPVPEIAAYISTHPVDDDADKVWEISLPSTAYLYENPAIGARPTSGMSPSFPHRLSAGRKGGEAGAEFYDRWQSSPFADEYLARMALAVTDARRLGRGDGTDMLAISFSTLDKVGHDYGPQSREIQDVLVRLDRTLGDLFDGLDRTLGVGRYTVALSADHGVPLIPERATALGFDAGRVSTAAVKNAAQHALATALGPGDFGLQLAGDYLYLGPGVYEHLAGKPGALFQFARALTAVPGVDRVFSRDELSEGARNDSMEKRAALSYFPGRSGDFMLSWKQNWIDGESAASHGSGYGYDTRVPIVLMGFGIVPGQYFQPASPADIAPTLATIAGITMGRTDGRVLSEALGR